MATGGQLQATSEEFIEYECTVCLKSNKIKNADRYCFDCQKYMCSECLQLHNNFGDKHNVLSVTDKRVQKVLTEKCEYHPDKVLEYYCRQHYVVVCQACLLDHRKCDDVKHIGESVAELSADPDIQAIPGQIDSALDHVNQIIETFDKYIKDTETGKHKFLEDLDKFAKSILSKIEEMRKRGKDDVTASHQRITSKANEKRNACVQAKDDLSKYSDEIKRSSKRNAHLIVLKNRSKKIAIQTETLCNVSKQMIKETAFCFRRNNRLSSLLAKFNSLLEESSKPIKQPTSDRRSSYHRQDEDRNMDERHSSRRQDRRSSYHRQDEDRNMDERHSSRRQDLRSSYHRQDEDRNMDERHSSRRQNDDSESFDAPWHLLMKPSKKN